MIIRINFEGIEAVNFKDVLTPRIVSTVGLGTYLNLFFLSNLTLWAVLVYVPVVGLFFRQTRYISYVFVGRVVLPITIGLLIVYCWISFHAVVEYKFMVRNVLRDFSSIQSFFDILSTLYAICIAFLLWKGLNDYDTLRNTLREEASTIQSINEFFHYLDEYGPNGVIIDEIRDIFILYIKNIVVGRKVVLSKENERFLKAIVGKVAKIEANDENDKIALSEIMKEMSNLSHIRSLRASYMETKMSPYLLMLLALISCFLLVPFLIKEPSPNLVIHALLFSLTCFFSFLFITLLDINNPFDGYWQIKTESFANVSEFLHDDKRDFDQGYKTGLTLDGMTNAA